LPILCAANRYWCIHSWDRTVIPKPFSRVEVYFGETISVPTDADAATVERLRLELEQRMLALYQMAWANESKERH